MKILKVHLQNDVRRPFLTMLFSFYQFWTRKKNVNKESSIQTLEGPQLSRKCVKKMPIFLKPKIILLYDDSTVVED